MTDPASQRKDELRAHARALRRRVAPPELAWELLRPLTLTLPAGIFILTYLPLQHEPDPGGIRSITDQPLALTRTPEAGRELTIHRFAPDTELEPHRFGFRQPVAAAPAVEPAEIGLALVPGLAFDPAGGRLGHGMGYYDRLLMRLPTGTPLVGLVAGQLVLESIPMLEHDVRMTHLLTEDALIRCTPDPSGVTRPG